MQQHLVAESPSETLAVDVMVKCPNAAGAGLDCTESGKQEKISYYGQAVSELEDQGISYAPAVFSSFGRRHPDVTKMIHQAAVRVARRTHIETHI